MAITLEDVWAGMVKQHDRQEVEMRLLRNEIQKHGVDLGQLNERCSLRGRTCMERMNRQSDEVARVRDNSQVIKIAQVKQETVALTVVKVVGGITGLSAVAVLLYKVVSWLAGT